MGLATVSTLMRIGAAVAFILLMCPPLAPAQDVSENPSGVICQQPECDTRKSLPFSASVPLDDQDAFVSRVKTLPASALGAGLPAIPFDLWLPGTLERHALRRDEYFATWYLDFGDEPASAIPRAGPDLCVEISVPLKENRTAKLLVGVAAGHIAYEQIRWNEIEPEVRKIHIQASGETFSDTLDVKTLSDLDARVRLPIELWPAVDLKTTITYSPKQPLRGQVVRFTISISNSGPRDAERAHADIYIGIPDEDQNMKEIRRDWFPRVPSGKTVSVDVSARLERGDATVLVNTHPHGICYPRAERRGQRCGCGDPVHPLRVG